MEDTNTGKIPKKVMKIFSCSHCNGTVVRDESLGMGVCQQCGKVKHYVFISYSTKNQDAADYIMRAFTVEGIPVWMSPYDIPVGSVYAGVITDAVVNCSGMVLLLTEASQSSPYVTSEVDLAMEYHKPLLPVQLDKLRLNKVFQFYVKANHIMQLTHVDDEDPLFQQLVMRVKGLVNGETVPSKPFLPPTSTTAYSAPRDGLRKEHSRPRRHGLIYVVCIAVLVLLIAVVGIFWNQRNQPVSSSANKAVFTELPTAGSDESKLPVETNTSTPTLWDEEYQLAMSHYNSKEYDKAFELFHRAAANGHSSAMYMLGNCYANGRGVNQSHSTAIEWYLKATDLGNEDAMYSLGVNYANGQGVPKDYTKAVEWFQKAADLNNTSAMIMLGNCYYHGYGVTMSHTEAVYWYQKAATAGNKHAMYNLGVCYKNGQGVKQDYEAAFEWYQKAANLGDAGAMNALAHCFHYGQGVAQDYTKAAEWYQKAADKGDVNSMYQIGFCYDIGQGVPQDYAKALEWYQKAASKEHAGAMFSIGYFYNSGQGVTKDYEKAVEWYQKSASLGNRQAMFRLGLCYEYGHGVPQDYATALEWYQQAYDKGYTNAKDGLERMKNLLSPQ